MRADERRIYHYDLEIGHRGDSTHVPTIQEIFAVWEERCLAKTAFHKLKNGKVLFQINDIRLDNEHKKASLLISVIDKSMPDPASANFETRETTVYRKGPQDGGNLAAHLVISMEPYKANTHLCLLEGVRRLTATNIYRLLNRLLRDAKEADSKRFTYPDPGGAKLRSGEPKRVSYLPLVKMLGHPSPSLIADLERGTIRGIKLIQTTEKTSLLDSDFLVQDSYELTLKIKPDAEQSGLWERITGAVRGHEAAYKTGRISFVDHQSILHNVDFDVETGEPNAEDYIKYTLLRDIDPVLADASATLVTHLEAKMLALLDLEQGG